MNEGIDSRKQLLIDWLTSKSPKSSKLLEWCNDGYLYGREQMAPHLQIFNLITELSTSEKIISKIASLLADLFSNHPDLKIPYANLKRAPRDLLLELLNLSAALEAGDILRDPLIGILHHFRDTKKSLDNILKIALKNALIYNGGDSYNEELCQLFLDMSEGKRETGLGGSPIDGVVGISYMPSKEDDQKPNRQALGFALRNLAIYWENDEDRWEKFRSVLRWIGERWNITNQAFFIELANNSNWHLEKSRWTVLSLPELFYENYGLIGKKKDKLGIHVDANVHDTLLRTGQIKKGEPYCGGSIFYIKLPKSLEKCIEDNLVTYWKAVSKNTKKIAQYNAVIGVALEQLEKGVLKGLKKQTKRSRKSYNSSKKLAALSKH
ncbi:MAG: hypothetical protein MI748_10570 [Opitutales bacterium]|nr:hypothetical protein [Opitutales bacterium]